MIAPVKKGGKEVAVEEVVIEKEPETVDYTESLHKGPRKYSVLELHYNLNQLLKTAESKIPAPIYPDPNSLPV